MPWLRRYVFDTSYVVHAKTQGPSFFVCTQSIYAHKEARKRTFHYTVIGFIYQILPSASGDRGVNLLVKQEEYLGPYPALNRGKVILCREYEKTAKRRSRIPTSPSIQTKATPNKRTITTSASGRFRTKK